MVVALVPRLVIGVAGELLAVHRQVVAAVPLRRDAQGADGLFATLEEAFSPDQCYRTPEGLAVYYQTYSVGPYAVGTPTFVISADQLGEMLRAWD